VTPWNAAFHHQGVGKYFGLGSGTIKYMLDEDRVKVVTFEEVPKFSFDLEVFGTGFDVLDLSHVAEALTPHLQLIEQFGCVSPSARPL
jgi:hypothetical protein